MLQTAKLSNDIQADKQCTQWAWNMQLRRLGEGQHLSFGETSPDLWAMLKYHKEGGNILLKVQPFHDHEVTCCQSCIIQGWEPINHNLLQELVQVFGLFQAPGVQDLTEVVTVSGLSWTRVRPSRPAAVTSRVIPAKLASNGLTCMGMWNSSWQGEVSADLEGTSWSERNTGDCTTCFCFENSRKRKFWEWRFNTKEQMREAELMSKNKNLQKQT